MFKPKLGRIVVLAVIALLIGNSILPSLKALAVTVGETETAQSENKDASNVITTSLSEIETKPEESADLKQKDQKNSKPIEAKEITGATENSETTVTSQEKETTGKSLKRSGPADVSGAVTLGNIEMSVKRHGNWYLVNPGDTIEVGNVIKFEVKWEIPSMTGIDAGSWFDIDLPSTYFDFAGTGQIDVKNSDNEIIGTMQIIPKTATEPAKIRFVINETGASKAYLKNGTFELEGSANRKKDKDDSTSVGTIPLPPFEIEEPDKNAEFPNMGTITKSGAQLSNQDEIQWRIDVNNEEYKNVYDGNSLSSPKKNMIVTDELPEGVKFKSISVGSLIFAATSGGKMSVTSIGWTDYKLNATTVTQESGDTWASFQAKVAGKTVTDTPYVGIFHDTDGRDKVMLNLGNLPGLEGPMYNDPPVVGDTLGKTKAIIDASSLSDDIKEKTKQAYEYIFAQTNNKGILGLTILINAEVTGKSGTYYNDAHAKWDEGEKGSGEIAVEYQKVGGKVESGEKGTITLVKEDPYGKQLKDVEFKLQKKDGSGNFVDYTPKDGVMIRGTDKDGIVKFADLEPGTYKLVEVKHGPEFSGNVTYTIIDPSGELSPTDEFTITGADKKGFIAKAVNEYKLIDIEGEKSWEDGNDKFGRRPDQITVVLTANGVEIERKVVSAADNWKYHFENLEPYDASGKKIKYEVTEETVPEYDGRTEGNDLINTLTTGAVELSKKDDKGNALAEAEFVLYRKDSNGQLEYYRLDGSTITWVSDQADATVLKTGNDGKILVVGLPEDTYYFKETKAPAGYVLDSTEHKVVVDGKTISEVVKKQLEVKNDPSEVIIEKVDANTKDVLPGAEFQLFNASDETLDKNYQSGGTPETYVTDKDGLIHLRKIPDGKYYLLETKAPDGYLTSNEKISFEVKGGRLVGQEKVTIENTRNGTLPKTGGIGLGLVTLIGLSTVMIGCLGVWYASHRDRRERS